MSYRPSRLASIESTDRLAFLHQQLSIKLQNHGTANIAEDSEFFFSVLQSFLTPGWCVDDQLRQSALNIFAEMLPQLKAIPGSSAVEALLNVLKLAQDDEIEGVRLAALNCLEISIPLFGQVFIRHDSLRSNFKVFSEQKNTLLLPSGRSQWPLDAVIWIIASDIGANDFSCQVRVAAIKLLGQIPPSFIDDYLLLSAFKKDTITMTANGSFKLPILACGVFAHGIEDHFVNVRFASLTSLASILLEPEIPPTILSAALPVLIDSLLDESDWLRIAALKILKTIADRGASALIFPIDPAFETILALLDDGNPGIRTAAFDLFGSLHLSMNYDPNSVTEELLEIARRTLKCLKAALGKNPRDLPKLLLSSFNFAFNHSLLISSIQMVAYCTSCGDPKFFEIPKLAVDETANIINLALLMGAAADDQRLEHIPLSVVSEFPAVLVKSPDIAKTNLFTASRLSSVLFPQAHVSKCPTSPSFTATMIQFLQILSQIVAKSEIKALESFFYDLSAFTASPFAHQSPDLVKFLFISHVARIFIQILKSEDVSFEPALIRFGGLPDKLFSSLRHSTICSFSEIVELFVDGANAAGLLAPSPVIDAPLFYINRFSEFTATPAVDALAYPITEWSRLPRLFRFNLLISIQSRNVPYDRLISHLTNDLQLELKIATENSESTQILTGTFNISLDTPGQFTGTWTVKTGLLQQNVDNSEPLKTLSASLQHIHKSGNTKIPALSPIIFYFS